MAAPQQVHVHGEDNFQCGPERWISRGRGRDAFEVPYLAPSREHAAYQPGQPAPGYAYMRIVEARQEQDGLAWVHNLTCEGIASQTQDWKELSRIDRSPEEGWDEIALTIYTRKPDDGRWRKGARLQRTDTDVTPPAGFENMFIVDRSQVWTEADGYYELNLVLKGLVGSKPYQRSINGAVVTSSSRFAGYTILTDDIFQNYPPTDSGSNASLDGDSILIEYDAASVTVSDTYLTSTEPPTEYIGRFWNPPDPPDVTVLTLSGEETKYFWPYGWKCVSMNSLKLPGCNVWVVTVNYIYQVPSIPVTATA